MMTVGDLRSLLAHEPYDMPVLLDSSITGQYERVDNVLVREVALDDGYRHALVVQI